MEYDVLNSRLSKLAENYGRVNRTGHDFAFMLTKTSAAATPAAAAIHTLSKAIYGGTDTERRGVESLRDHLLKLQDEDRKSTITQRNLQRRLVAMERQHGELESFQTELKRKERRLLSLQTLTKDQQEQLATIRKQMASNVQVLDRLGSSLARGDRQLAQNLERQVRAKQQFRESAEAVLDVTNALSGVSKVISGAVTVTGLKMAVSSSFQFNRSLIEANSTLQVREKLWQGVIDAQMKTGDSLDNISAIMVGLRSQTQLYRGDWQKAVEESSKFQQSVGATVDDTMALQNAARGMRLTFKELGDTVVRVVDQTSMSVRNAVDMVKELKTVLMGFNISTTGSKFEAVTKQVAALEEAMKEQGASEGAAMRVLKQFSDMRQRGGQGFMFGSGGPDFLSDANRTREVTKNLAAYLRQFQNNSLVFAQVAESVGLSAEDAQALIRATDHLGDAERRLADSRKTIEDRFREQSAASGKVYAQLLNNLKALVLEGLSPVTSAVNRLNGWLEGLRGFILKVREAMPDWMATTVKYASAAAAFVAVGVAASKAVTTILLVREALLALAAMNAAGQIGSAVAGGVAARGVVAAGRSVAGKVIGGAATAAAGGAVVGAGKGLIQRAVQFGKSTVSAITGRPIATTTQAAKTIASTAARPVAAAAARTAVSSAATTVAASAASSAATTAATAAAGGVARGIAERSIRSIGTLAAGALKAIGASGAAKVVLRGAAKAGTAVAGSGVMGGALSLVRGLLPMLVGMIPAVLPFVAVAAVGALAVYGWRKVMLEADKGIQSDMAMMRRTKTVAQMRESAGSYARKALDVKSGTQAAKAVVAALPSQKKAIMDAWRKGDASQDARVLSKMIDETKRRVEVQKAQIQREATTAPAARREEMQQGLKDLLGAVLKLEEAQRQIAEEQKRINEKNRREEREKDDRQEVQKRVTNLALSSRRQNPML